MAAIIISVCSTPTNVEAAPNKTPTAKPSGILCKVIAKTNNVDRCNSVFTPSASLFSKLMCK